MTNWSRFSSQIKSPDLVPEPFRGALLAALNPGVCVRLLIQTPPADSPTLRHGPMLLAITDRGWICLEQTPASTITVSMSDFAATVRAELGGVLLAGTFRISFADGPQVRSVALEFNTVMERLYWQALQLLLHGIAGHPPAAAVRREDDLSVIKPLPLKFFYSVWNHTPPDEHVRAIAHWPAAVATYHRWFQRELAPEAMFALGERELIFIAEEKARLSLRIGRENKYGDIATYLPFSRLREFRFPASAGPLGRLELTVGAGGASETLVVEFPAGHRQPIQEIIERAFRENTNRPSRHAHEST
jgi:hypothetical protein